MRMRKCDRCGDYYRPTYMSARTATGAYREYEPYIKTPESHFRILQPKKALCMRCEREFRGWFSMRKGE